MTDPAEHGAGSSTRRRPLRFALTCGKRWRGLLWLGCPRNQLAPGGWGPHKCIGSFRHFAFHKCAYCGKVRL